MDWYSNENKSGVIRDVMAKGFSVRKAEKGVNAVLDCMRQALARGESVEVPGGTLRVQLRRGRARKESCKKLRNVNTGRLFLRKVQYPGSHRVIRFEPDPNLNLDHCAEFPPPTRPIAACPWLFESRDPDVAEAWKLAAEVLDHPVDTEIMDQLAESAARNPRQPGHLLEKLRCRRRLGYHAPGVTALSYDLINIDRW